MQMGLVSLGWGGVWVSPALATLDLVPSSELTRMAESEPLAPPTVHWPQSGGDAAAEVSLPRKPEAGTDLHLTLPTPQAATNGVTPGRFVNVRSSVNAELPVNAGSSETAGTEISIPKTPATTAADLRPLANPRPDTRVDFGGRSASADVLPGGIDDANVSPTPPAIAQSPAPPENPSPTASDEGEDLDQLPQDPELGVIRVRNPLEDPELGILRIRQLPDSSSLPTAPAPKIAFLTARFSGVSSDNVLLVVNDAGGLTGGQFYRPSAVLGIYPSLGPTTALLGTLEIGLQRYPTQPTLDYDDWRIRLGLRQNFTPRTYAQLNLSYQELLRPGLGPRIFDNKSVGLTLARRDPITPQLVLDSSYQVQYNDARSRSVTSSGTVITNFSRITHTLNAYLGYTPNNRWHTGLNYQYTIFDYTIQNRYDTVQQILAQVVYNITPRLRLSVYGGWSFGGASDPRIRYDDTILGFSLETTLPLF